MRTSTSPQRAAGLLRRLTPLRPELAIVLGSGFHGITAEFRGEEQFSYSRLPGFPPARALGHSGKIIAAHFEGVPVLVLCGRAHYYEGHSMSAVTFPVRVLAEFGIRRLLLTNAAGGISTRFKPGDFMCLTDHLNFMGANPLRGERDGRRNCFVDLSQVYDNSLARLLLRAARDTRVRVRRGIYLAVSGPSYETPAEIRAFARLGADAVGMSTVPEAIVARQCGLAVAGLSCITNLAAGRSPQPLRHSDVLAMGEKSRIHAVRLLRRFVELQAAPE